VVAALRCAGAQDIENLSLPRALNRKETDEGNEAWLKAKWPASMMRNPGRIQQVLLCENHEQRNYRQLPDTALIQFVPDYVSHGRTWST
jgi:hypothetical protein